MAEIQSKIINCSHCGKYYDVANLANCPYCGTPATKFSKTIDPDIPATSKPMSETIDPYVDNQNAAISGKFPKTEPPLNDKNGSTGNFPKTVAIELWEGENNSQNAIKPVVAWIVAFTGMYKGKDFIVHTGYNYIGRETGDIIISGDGAISREKDACISYVHQTNRFYIAHVQGDNILMVNDTPVIGGTIELNPYDVITIGNTQFVFIPLCGPRFNWKDGVSDA